MNDPQGSSSTCRLEVGTTASGDAMLEIALDGRSHPDGPGLEFLSGDYDHECWRAPADQLCAIVLGEPDEREADAAVAAEVLYRKLIRTLGESRFGYPLRLWNYLPAINHGDNDLERYRRFCIAAPGRWKPLD